VSTGARFPSSGVKRPEREADHSPRSGAKIHAAVRFYEVASRHTERRYCSCLKTTSSQKLLTISKICTGTLLTLREERRLRVFENRVLRRVFGPKRDEVTGEWRKLHNEELSDLYSLPNIVRVVKSRRMRWAGHVARMGWRGVYRVLVGKPEEKRPLGRPRRRWEDNIKMDLQEVGGGCGDWMELAQDRDRWRALVSTVMNLRVPNMRGIS